MNVGPSGCGESRAVLGLSCCFVWTVLAVPWCLFLGGTACFLSWRSSIFQTRTLCRPFSRPHCRPVYVPSLSSGLYRPIFVIFWHASLSPVSLCWRPFVRFSHPSPSCFRVVGHPVSPFLLSSYSGVIIPHSFQSSVVSALFVGSLSLLLCCA